MCIRDRAEVRVAVGGVCPRLWRDTARASDGGVIDTFVSEYTLRRVHDVECVRHAQ